jgi:hypothetical protein
MVFVQAGTAVSNRHKGEVNSFNVLHPGRSSEGEKHVSVERYAWDQQRARFICHNAKEYQLGREGWATVQPASSG